MKERPILFSAPMVRAILEGRKTQTRRVMSDAYHAAVEAGLDWPRQLACPHGKLGDRLWVREAVWLPPPVSARDLREGADTWPKCIYSADADSTDIDWMREQRWKQHPSIHCPRWASRILLEVTDVRVHRLQDISEEDARAEGVTVARFANDVPGRAAPLMSPDCYRAGFACLWGSINAKRGFSFASNPWVWALTFKRVTP